MSKNIYGVIVYHKKTRDSMAVFYPSEDIVIKKNEKIILKCVPSRQKGTDYEKCPILTYTIAPSKTDTELLAKDSVNTQKLIQKYKGTFVDVVETFEDLQKKVRGTDNKNHGLNRFEKKFKDMTISIK